MSTDPQQASEDGEPGTGDDQHRFTRLLRAPAVMAGLLLVGIMALTTVDVAFRYLASAPIFGAHELTEIAMVALVMLAMPYCAATGGHIRVDVLDNVLGRTGRLLSDLVAGLIGLLVLGFLTWRSIVKVWDTYAYQDLSNMLLLPIWPLYLLIVFGMAGYVLVIVRDLWRLLTRRDRPS